MNSFVKVCIAIFALSASLAHATSNTFSDNAIVWHGQKVDRVIESNNTQFRVVSKALVMPQPFFGLFGDGDHSLVLGFPRSLIGQQNVFGGVITGVSHPDNETLGGLKLADMPPLHVSTVLSQESKSLLLRGCVFDCDESSVPMDLLAIPIVSSDVEFIYLDLTAFGSQLDFLNLISSGGVAAEKTEVKRFDFTASTLVFDVDNTYTTPLDEGDAPITFKTTTRWFLKLSSGFNANFDSRQPVDAVGYFTTFRGKNTYINRFAYSDSQGAFAKYYIKNVPVQFRQAFADSFEDWNKNLLPILGKKFFTYEFLETTDPRYNEIVMGDIRYNVLEWDITNHAGYGGLGPSLANQYTGEIFSANVNIQGPQVIKLYSHWWGVASDVKDLQNKGLFRQAEILKAKYVKETAGKIGKKTTAQMMIGALKFHIRSADPRISDPALDAGDFLEQPAGYNFDTYMYGYFRDMVAHELGHNIGLRHNFKGNLGANESGEIGTVSRSIMEYLDREHRHLDRVGPYDLMAVAYGYKNETPTQKDWFCTDEDQVSSEEYEQSAECSSGDASNDPYSLLLMRLQKMFDYLILPGSELAPVWTVEVLRPQIAPLVSNLANYYVSSFSQAKNWLNFNNDKRKITPEASSEYILSSIAEIVCNPNYVKWADQKTPEAKAQTLKNIQDFNDVFKIITSEYLNPNAGFTEQNFPCLK